MVSSTWDFGLFKVIAVSILWICLTFKTILVEGKFYKISRFWSVKFQQSTILPWNQYSINIMKSTGSIWWSSFKKFKECREAGFEPRAAEFRRKNTYPFRPQGLKTSICTFANFMQIFFQQIIFKHLKLIPVKRRVCSYEKIESIFKMEFLVWKQRKRFLKNEWMSFFKRITKFNLSY